MERRRLTALTAGFACLLLGLAAGCTPAETSPTPDAAATPAAGAPPAGGAMGGPPAGGAPAGGEKAAPPGPPTAPK